MEGGLRTFWNDTWKIGNFKFKDTLRQVQWLLENEIDLIQEQGNLKTAGRYFHANAAPTVPDWLPCSTSAMTAMTRLDGHKITDVRNLDASQRRQLATALLETCIVRPVKDLSDKTIFHGDPHSGNIAYRFEESQPRIIFYDRGMMGRLNRLERFSLGLMMIGVIWITLRSHLYDLFLPGYHWKILKRGMGAWLV